MALTADLTDGIREGQRRIDCWNLNGMLGKAETTGVIVIIT